MVNQTPPVDKLIPADYNPRKDLKPGDPGYEEARRPFNSVIGLKPAWIACCRTESDVVAAVRHAKELDLPAAVKSGGHAFHGFSLNEGGLLVELTGMANRVLDKDSHRFSAGPGLKLRDSYSWLMERGRILPAGSCGGVGLAVLHDGEKVLTPEQQQQGGVNITVNGYVGSEQQLVELISKAYRQGFR